MEEAAQILEVETFIPMLLQDIDLVDGCRLKRGVLIGDHHQVRAPGPEAECCGGEVVWWCGGCRVLQTWGGWVSVCSTDVWIGMAWRARCLRVIDMVGGCWGSTTPISFPQLPTLLLPPSPAAFEQVT